MRRAAFVHGGVVLALTDGVTQLLCNLLLKHDNKFEGFKLFDTRLVQEA